MDKLVIPSGWQITSKGAKRLELHVGDLSRMLLESYPDQLEFNLLTGVPEIDRHEISSGIVENFYVPLSELGYKINKGAATDGLLYAAQKKSYHPVVEFLLGIELNDSVEPIDLNTVASSYLDVEDELSNAMLAACLIGLIARAFQPGIKFDNCLVLQGAEGIRKSSFWRTLASDDWFCDTWQDKDQDLYMAINQCWLYELAELDYMTTKKDQGRLKGLFSSATDTFKRPYARGTGKFPRPSILVATSNRFDFLSDPSATHRRYWVIQLPHDPELKQFIDINKLKVDRERILKAAILAYRNGHKPFLTQEQQNESNLRNESFQSEHPFMARLAEWVQRESFPFSTEQALIGSYCRTEENIKPMDSKEAANCLRALGFEKDEHQTHCNGIKQPRKWRRKPQIDQ